MIHHHTLHMRFRCYVSSAFRKVVIVRPRMTTGTKIKIKIKNPRTLNQFMPSVWTKWWALFFSFFLHVLFLFTFKLFFFFNFALHAMEPWLIWQNFLEHGLNEVLFKLLFFYLLRSFIKINTIFNAIFFYYFFERIFNAIDAAS